MFLNCAALQFSQHGQPVCEAQPALPQVLRLEMLKLFAVAAVNVNVEPGERSWPDPVIYSEPAVGITYGSV